jgi:DNA-binding CsgD family transcriptional regulator
LELVERAFQLHTLESALSEVQAGEGCVALVYGEAGIGKTSLVEHFTKGKEKSWRILSGACDLLFTPRPLGPLGDIALQTKGLLLRLLDSGDQRDRIFSACLTELKSRPTILIIEDIHWADEATLDLLKYLGRRIRQTTCLMILTYRDDEIAKDSPLQLLLGDLASLHCPHRVPVAALSIDGVRQLAQDRKVDVPALHRLTNGNPFFLTEVLAGDGGIPPSVRDAMLARAARMSPTARDALEAAAVAGLHVESWLLEEITDSHAAGVEECISKGMLQSQGHGYAFRHELSRQAVLDRVPINRKRELDRRALAALQACSETRTDWARLISHAEGAGEADAVLQFAPAAARQAAAAGAHRQAAALYELALRYAEALPGAEHAQVLEAYADELRFQGRSEAFVPLHREIIERYCALGDRLRQGSSLARLASEFQGIGRNADAEQAIRASVEMLEALPPSVELAQAYGTQCYLLGDKLDYGASVAVGEKAIALAERFGDVDLVARAGNIAGSELLLMGDERGRALLDRSLTAAREHGLHYAVGMVLVNWANALVGTFQFEDAARLLQEGMLYTAQHDDDYHGADMPVSLAEIRFRQGRWTEAAELVERQLRRLGSADLVGIDAMRILGRLGVRRGDASAQSSLRGALASYTQASSLELAGNARAGLAEEAWLRADSHQASGEARAAYDLVASSHVPWTTGELAFWRWRAGEDFTPPEWIAKPYALQIAGDWCCAAEEWERRDCPYEQAMALMDGDEAAEITALEIFEELGARPILDKLKQKMRLEGVRSIPRGPRPTTRENAFGLTAREMEVLSCLVRGSTNNFIGHELCLSPRTVEHHITSILQKMGVQSRVEAVALTGRDSRLRFDEAGSAFLAGPAADAP